MLLRYAVFCFMKWIFSKHRIEWLFSLATRLYFYFGCKSCFAGNGKEIFYTFATELMCGQICIACNHRKKC
jgi:hypothetical protein